MDTNYFEYIISVKEYGSINRAASKLHISQPNLSAAIKNAERELGFSVFIRTSRGVRLTPEGELFFHHAKSIMHELAAVKNIPFYLKGKDNLSISCTNSFDFMNAFMQFKRKYPAIEYEDIFKETGLIQTVRDIVDMKYRMSLFYCFNSISERYQAYAKDHGLSLITVAKNKDLILLVSKTHPLAGKASVNLEEIHKYKFVTYENYLFDEWLGPIGYKNDHRIFYVFDRGGLLDAIKNGQYVTVMMKRFTDNVYSKECVELPIIGTDEKLDVFLFCREGYIFNQREKLFIRALKKIFAA